MCLSERGNPKLGVSELNGGAMCVLIVLGWIIAGIVWWQFGWVWGVIAVVLFAVSGFGWKLLEVGAACTWYALSPSRHQFKKAWRDLDCDHVDVLGPDAYQHHFLTWGTRYKGLGRSARDYLLPWTTFTSEDQARFEEAWAELGCDQRFGPQSFDHWFYQWLTARSTHGAPADPKQFIRTTAFELDIMRGQD